VHDIQHAVNQTVEAIAGVSSSVTTMSEANRQLTGILDHQATEIDRIGSRAEQVAGAVGGVLPEISTIANSVEAAGNGVLTTAEDLLGRSKWLADAISSYFTDLEHGSIKIGILHSLSGTMTASERPLQELLVMLIEQQNARGGLLGRPIEPVIVNPHSDAKAYAELARKLIAEHKVAAIFGCWSSASRKEVLPIVERDNALLFYPSQSKARRRRATSSIPARRRRSRPFRRSTSCATRASTGSSWSAPITSIHAPPTPSSKAIWRASMSPTSPSATRLWG
jgi:urea transport system substrate-binding protein